MTRPVHISSAVAIQEESGSDGQAAWLEVCLTRVGRKVARGMTRSALLMCEAAERCLDETGETLDREVTPLFIGAPSGPEIVLPYLDIVVADADAGRPAHTPANVLEDRRAGNALGFLRLSQGNACGHVAQLTGVRGANASLSGLDSSIHALRKAWRGVAAGWFSRALVVTGECLYENVTYDGGELRARRTRDGGAAVLLSASPGHGPSSLLAMAAPALGEVEMDDQGFEAAQPLIDTALAHLRGAPLTGVRRDHWGNHHAFVVHQGGSWTA